VYRRVTGETQPIIRIADVLPAPFGPRNPKASPGATSKSIPSTAVSLPNRFVSPRAWMSDVSGDPGMGAHRSAHEGLARTRWKRAMLR
jgi:hypothetical protein